MRIPNFNKNFTLTTDASNLALGAVLSQENHPIRYISRSENGSSITETKKQKLAMDIIQKEWHSMASDQCLTLIKAMPNRCAEVTRQKEIF